MSEAVFLVGLEVVGAVIAATVFVVDSLREEADAILSVADVRKAPAD